MKIDTDRSKTVKKVVLIEGKYYVGAFIVGVYSTTEKESDYSTLFGSAKHVTDDETGGIDIVYDIRCDIDSLTAEIKKDLTDMINDFKDNRSVLITHLETNLALMKE